MSANNVLVAYSALTFSVQVKIHKCDPRASPYEFVALLWLS